MYEVKGETPNISNLATAAAAFTAIESYTPNVNNSIKKTNYSTKINKIEKKIATDQNHDKYVNTQEFNKLTSESFTARLKQATLKSKSDIIKFVKKTDFDNKIKDVISNKNELNELSRKAKAILPKVWTKYLINKFSIFNGAKHFSLEIF